MRTKLTILAGILGFCATLQAGTSYTSFTLDFNTTQGSSGLQFDTVGNNSYAISPYTGTVNGATVQLYCDDFNDTINYGQQNINVYSTALTGNLAPTTRYGVDNPSSNSSYPSGTTLYEEMAWLATQMQTAGSTNDKAIQEAIWQLTDAPGGSSAPNNSSGYSGTASSGTTGTAQSAAKWISDAQSYIAGFNGTTSSWSYASHYSNLVVGDWYVITATASAGCTTGSSGTLGCTPGSAGTGSTTQEFLAFKTGGLVTTTTNTTGGGGAVPEPATFVLIGSGLLGGMLVKRRKKA